jgi:hypothetical protein
VLGGLYIGNGGAAGSGQLLLGDMLGNHYLLVSAYLRSQIEQSEFLLQYADLGQRWQWGVAGYQFRDELGLFTAPDSVQYSSMIRAGVQGSVAYPFNRFRRVEFSMDLQTVNNETASLLFSTGQQFRDREAPRLLRDPGCGARQGQRRLFRLHADRRRPLPDLVRTGARQHRVFVRGAGFPALSELQDARLPGAALHRGGIGGPGQTVAAHRWPGHLPRRGLRPDLRLADRARERRDSLPDHSDDRAAARRPVPRHGDRLARRPGLPAGTHRRAARLPPGFVHMAVGFGFRAYVGLPLRFDVALPTDLQRNGDWRTMFAIGYDY